MKLCHDKLCYFGPLEVKVLVLYTNSWKCFNASNEETMGTEPIGNWQKKRNNTKRNTPKTSASNIPIIYVQKR